MLRRIIKEHQVLILVLILAASLRLFAALWLPPVDTTGGDFALYDRMAKNLLSLGDFGGEPEKTLGTPNINPGQALWLALIYFIFGSSRAVVIGWQIVLGTLLAWAAYLLAQELFGRKAGAAAALIVAVFPPLIIITVEPYNTLLYSALFAFSILFIFKSIKNHYFAIPAGIFMALAILNESIAFYIPAIIVLWLFILRLGYKQTGMILGIFLLSAGLTLAPWVVRNIMAAKGEVRVIAKGELQLVSPDKISSYSGTLADIGFLASGMKNMFFMPYGLWRLDHGPLSYASMPMRVLKGESFPSEVLANFAIKAFSTLLYWALLALSLWSALKFRRFGFLLLLLLAYTAVAGLGYVAYQGGDFSKASHLSSFVAPFLPLFAAFSSGFIMVKMRSSKSE